MNALSLLALALPAARAACDAPLTPAALDAALVDLMSAWEEVDAPRFDAGIRQLRAEVPCLSAPLRPDQAARLHRAMGVAQASAGELEAAALSFAAARAAEPELGLPVPERHPLLAVYHSVSSDAPRAPLASPGEGELRVDGAPAAARAQAWPAVVQWVVEGEVRRSELLSPGQAPAPWPAPAQAWVEAPAPLEPTSSRENRARELPVARIAAAGGAAALAGGLWAGSAAQAARVEAAGDRLGVDPSGALQEMASARKGANALGGAAIGSAALAAGLGLSVVFTF